MKFTEDKDLGLLVMRLGLGIFMMVHGAPKMMGGVEKWTKIGGAMENIGITFLPAFWGFMAAFAEFIGGLCLILGAFMPISLALLASTMLIAASMHLRKDGLSDASHALELLFVFIGLFFTGAGKYSLDAKIREKKSAY